MRLATIAFIAVALSSATAAAASDDDDVSVFESKPTAFYSVFGLGTPVGLMGVELERTLLPNWSISAGGGWDLSGFQASAMTRLLLGASRRARFTIGAGISGGKYDWKESCFDCDEVAEKIGTVAWGNLEIGGEHRFESGFALRYFGGYGHIVAGDLVCTGYATASCVAYHQNDGRDTIYTGIALGGAF